jgi:NAD-dependent dihydropyrimidine dehydrogenase PreA subunit
MKDEMYLFSARRTVHLPFPRHDKTAFIQIDMKSCSACGRCIIACKHQVLGMISLFRHRHVHVDQASACRGCRRCSDVCPQQAIRALAEARSAAS